MANKKGLSPLVATILLVVFALIIGTATMKFGQDYVNDTGVQQEDFTISIPLSKLDNDLKKAQLDYISGKDDLDRYLEREKKALSQMR